MRAADLTTAAVLMLGGLLVLWDSLRLGIGWGTDGPRSGFFPFWLSVFLLAACAAIAWQSWHRGGRRAFIAREGVAPVLKVLIPAAVFVLLIQLIGLYVATVVYMAGYMRWIGRYGWPVVILISVAVPVALFAVFEIWFLVPMPKGPLEAALGY